MGNFSKWTIMCCDFCIFLVSSYPRLSYKLVITPRHSVFLTTPWTLTQEQWFRHNNVQQMVNHYCKRRQWLGQECSTLSPSSTSRYTHHRPPAICKCWAHPHASDSKICPLSPGAGKRQVVVASATNPILCGRAYWLCGFHGRKSHTPTPPTTKGLCFVLNLWCWL